MLASVMDYWWREEETNIAHGKLKMRRPRTLDDSRRGSRRLLARRHGPRYVRGTRTGWCLGASQPRFRDEMAPIVLFSTSACTDHIFFGSGLCPQQPSASGEDETWASHHETWTSHHNVCILKLPFLFGIDFLAAVRSFPNSTSVGRDIEKHEH